MLRQVFLFGAGSVISWGGPTTHELTELVRKSGFKVCNSDTTITEFIYQKLIESGYKVDEVNFETIINAIEELIVYHSEFNATTRSPSLLRCFVKDCDHTDIFNYNTKPPVRRHGYTLQIPKGIDYEFTQHAINNENPDVFFLSHLLSDILSGVIGRISNYAYHSETFSKIDTNSKDSINFLTWIARHKLNSVIRLYTLNYDRLFKVLLRKNGIECFEGFDTLANPDEVGKSADIPRIINDRDRDCYYNLHGSAWWRVKSDDWKGLYNSDVFYSGAPELPINDSAAALKNIQKGRPIMISNIVTGYQKAEKGMFSPIKEMHASFESDCISADTIFIVGYSFGDEHINDCIRVALRYNPKLKIEIIDPKFFENLEEFFTLHIYPYSRNDLNPKNVAENLYQYNDGQILIHALPFQEYLEEYSEHQLCI